jgi:hypothetical protein
VTAPAYELHRDDRLFVAPTSMRGVIRFTRTRGKAAWFNQHRDAELFRRNQVTDSARWTVVAVEVAQ